MSGGTTPKRTCAGAFVALFAVPWLLGCAQIAGTNEYGVGESTKKAGAVTPFLTGSQCEDCTAAHCGKQLAACEADQVCAPWLADIRARPDPLSAYARYQTEIGLVWQADHEGQPYNDSIASLRACAQQCLAPCEIGQNFSCVGEFEWHLPSPTVLRTRATESGVHVPTRVSACSSADQCDTPLAAQDTDEEGFAGLNFEPDTGAPEPIGYLQFARLDDRPWQWVQTRPLADNDYVPLDYIGSARFEQWHEAFGQSFDSNQGVLIVVPVDCSGVNAKQVTLEAWYYRENRLTFCSDCFYAYGQDTTETPNAELHAYATTGRGGFIAHVAPGVVYVVLRRVGEPKDIVSVARLLVRGGGVATVRAYPSSKQQVLAFPDPRK